MDTSVKCFIHDKRVGVTQPCQTESYIHGVTHTIKRSNLCFIIFHPYISLVSREVNTKLYAHVVIKPLDHCCV